MKIFSWYFRVALLFGVVLAVPSGINPLIAEDHPLQLAMSRSQLEDLITQHYAEQFGGLTEAKVCFATAKDPKSEARAAALLAKLHPDDTVYLDCNFGLPFTFTIAEADGVVHTVRVFHPIVNYSDDTNENVYLFLSDLTAGLFPGWDGARDWPREALLAAWDRAAIVDYEAYKENPDRVFERHTEGALTASAVGVPPDIIQYDFSVLERCKLTADKEEPLRRIIC